MRSGVSIEAQTVFGHRKAFRPPELGLTGPLCCIETAGTEWPFKCKGKRGNAP